MTKTISIPATKATLTGMAADIHDIIIANKNILPSQIAAKLKELKISRKDKDGKEEEVAKYNEPQLKSYLIALNETLRVDQQIAILRPEMVLNYDATTHKA